MIARLFIAGVPAAGHVSRGYWHPGRIEGCPKCPTDPKEDRRGPEPRVHPR